MVGLEKVRRAPLAVALSLFGLCGFIALPVAPSHAAPAVISAIPEPPETLEAYPADRDPIKIGLRWEDHSINEAGFEVEKRLREQGEYVRIATVPANQTQYVDADVRNGVQYQYQVRAVNADGPSGYSNSVTAFFGNPGKFRVEPDRLDFGRVKVGAQRTRRFSVKNTGRVVITLNITIEKGGPFTIQSGGGVVELEPRRSRRVAVVFAPTKGGRQNGWADVAYGDSLVRVRLKGQGVQPR